MDKGEITVSWSEGETQFTRECFVSRPDNIIICRISSSKPESINAFLSLGRHDESDAPIGSKEDYFPPQYETIWDNNTLGYFCQNDDGTDFGAVTRVISSEGNLKYKENKVEISKSSEIILMTRLFIKGSYKVEWNKLKGELSNINFTANVNINCHPLGGNK